MPTSDLDMPLLPSAEQIRRREFATVRRGYDPEQVRMYLGSIAEQVETLERQLSQLRLETDTVLARKGSSPEPSAAPATQTEDPYEALSRRFASLIETADQEASRTIDDAREEAARTIEQARSEADRIKVDAQAHAEEARQQGTDLLERAKTESDRALSSLAERRDGLVAQLGEMHSKLLSVAAELAMELQGDEAGAEGMDGSEDIGELQAALAAPAAEPAAAETAAAAAAAPDDPRYEDLWVSADPAIELPDLASIDLDFDDPEP
jgi:DivIVA domain-containing protein